MQFGFKRNHSTVLCSAIYIEISNNYVNEGSDVYNSCLIDASKAFDRVHWGRLLKILIERNVSTLFIRLLLDSYLREKSCVAWGVFKVLEKCTNNLIGHSRLAFNNHESNIDC